MGHSISSLNTPAHKGTSNIDYESIYFTSLNEEHERDRINTPSPEKTDIINYTNPFDPSLLNELVQFGLSGSIYSNSISTYDQFGISSPKKFAAEPGGGKMPNINPHYKAEEKKLNADAPEYIPCINKYSYNKPPIPCQIMTNYEHKSPLIEEYEAKHKKRKKKKKTIDSLKRFGAEGNMCISHALTEHIIPNRIKYQIPNLFKYMDGSTIMQYDNQYKNDKIRILNYDFYDKNSEEMLYCVAFPYVHGSFKWKMEEILYTEKEIMDKFGLDLCDIPASLRNTKAFEDTKEMEKIISAQIKNGKNKKENMIWSCKWRNMKVHAEKKKKQRLILAIDKVEFIDNVLQWIDKNGVNMLPILVFNSKNDGSYHIEYVQIIKIETANIDIGVSYNYQKEITGIYLNKNDILERHMLVSPNHNCHCLDNFVSNIDVLIIGNPDDESNKINALNNRIKALKNKLK